MLASDALASTEESAAASRRALEEATRQHEEHSKELGELMDRAVELGLKSKVRGGGGMGGDGRGRGGEERRGREGGREERVVHRGGKR